MMNLYFDTEFTGLHKDTTLISIGIVAGHTGREFYAELYDCDMSQIDEWIADNVIKNLKYKEEFSAYRSHVEPITRKDFSMIGDKALVKEYLTQWLAQFNEPLQMVSDVCQYDMVLFIDIFGTAFDLPENVSPTCHDINQDIARYLGISEREAFNVSREKLADWPSKMDKKHNAIHDARVIRAVYDRVNQIYDSRDMASTSYYVNESGR